MRVPVDCGSRAGVSSRRAADSQSTPHAASGQTASSAGSFSATAYGCAHFVYPHRSAGLFPARTALSGLAQRAGLAGLIGEDKLLFTFRFPGLLHRDGTGGANGDERQIRALVLSLPSGAVEAEATWTLHDRARYLWMLNDGHFLLRDRNNLLVGDSSLALKPFLQFPGPLLWLELDPSQQYMVTDSYEPPSVAAKTDDGLSPSTASASITQDATQGGTQTRPKTRPRTRPPARMTPALRRTPWSASCGATPARSCSSAASAPPCICPSTPSAILKTCAASAGSGCST